MSNGTEVEQLEEPEGLDKPSSDDWADYPLDSVFVRTEPRTVGELDLDQGSQE
jgi:hypothetical protein